MTGPLVTSADVAIVGAGTAGAAAALLCARRGLDVVCVERGTLDTAGARWVNGVPRAAFERAGIDPPVAPERRGPGGRFHLVCGWDGPRITAGEHGVLDVDMRLLVARLQRAAQSAGVTFVEKTEVTGFDGRVLSTTGGSIRAGCYVDASGLTGARLLDQATPSPGDLCAAAQAVHRVADAPSARAFFEQRGVTPGDTLCFTGVAGGYSIVNVRIEGDEVSLLTGSIPAEGNPSGKQLLDRFIAEHPFIGPRCFGGSRAIPLGRPTDRLATDRVALLGDAGGQVFSAHGSGVGAGLVAARLLADSIAIDGSPEHYGFAWQRRYGGLFAGYDVLRRFSQRLTEPELQTLFESGLIDSASATAALDQELPRLSMGTLRAPLRGAFRAPRLAAKLVAALGTVVAAHALYTRYPRSSADLRAWSRRAQQLFRDGHEHAGTSAA